LHVGINATVEVFYGHLSRAIHVYRGLDVNFLNIQCLLSSFANVNPVIIAIKLKRLFEFMFYILKKG